MQLVLLAAGRGSRLPKKYRIKPKCLTKIGPATILDFNKKFFDNFQTKIIITGYKRQMLQEYIKENNFKEIENKNFRKTNMVQSLMLSSRYLKKNEEIVICYGDIIFNKDIFKIFKRNKGNIITGNKNWLKYWKKRMTIKNIKSDAETFSVRKNILKNIGDKITNKFPKYQYMGIFKISYNTFVIMRSYFDKINNKKIDMTGFLNLCINNNGLKIKKINYSSFWHEIDNEKDILIARRDLI